MVEVLHATDGETFKFPTPTGHHVTTIATETTPGADGEAVSARIRESLASLRLTADKLQAARDRSSETRASAAAIEQRWADCKAKFDQLLEQSLDQTIKALEREEEKGQQQLAARSTGALGPRKPAPSSPRKPAPSGPRKPSPSGTLKPSPGGFTPPDAASRISAVGKLSGLSLEEAAAFNPRSEAFAPMPAPKPGDWLWTRGGAGQTFERWLRSGANIPAKPRRAQQPGEFTKSSAASGRDVIYLLPLGDFDAAASPAFDQLARWCAAFYSGLRVRVLDAVPSSATAFAGIGRRALDDDDGRAVEGVQLRIADIMKLLKRTLPGDAYCVTALTMYDLYADGYNFLFGRASMKERTGVFSFARYDPHFWGEARAAGYRHELLWRSCNVMTHEIGHMFNFMHCVHFHCRMNGANTLEEGNDRPPDICPICLRKLHAAVRFDCAERYAALAATARDFCEELGDGRFARDRPWFEARVREIAPPARAAALIGERAAAAAATGSAGTANQRRRAGGAGGR